MKILILSTAENTTHAQPLRQAGFICDQAKSLDELIAMYSAFRYPVIMAYPSDSVTLCAMEQFLLKHADNLRGITVFVVTDRITHYPLPNAEIGLHFISPATDLSKLEQRLWSALGQGAGEQDTVSIDGLHVSLEARTVSLYGQPVDLTAREFALIELFVCSPTRVFTRTEILDRVWQSDYTGDGRVVDTFVKKLRKKLGGTFIDTVRSVGYRFLPASRTVPGRSEAEANDALDLKLVTRVAQELGNLTGDDALSLVQTILQQSLGVEAVAITDAAGQVLTQSPQSLALDTRALRQAVSSHTRRHDPAAVTWPAGPGSLGGAAVFALSRRHGEPPLHFVVMRARNRPDWTSGEQHTLEVLTAVLRPPLLQAANLAGAFRPGVVPPSGLSARASARRAVLNERQFLHDLDRAAQQADREDPGVDVLFLRIAPAVRQKAHLPANIRMGDHLYKLRAHLYAILPAKGSSESLDALERHVTRLSEQSGAAPEEISVIVLQYPRDAAGPKELLSLVLDENTWASGTSGSSVPVPRGPRRLAG
ncbi:winged helix-turn-helix domain-containing protein (plasmid) [Deinococcus taeanensis]|uniref:winged helix-turn-helix domain-containing protein n=1 Tax=Deinococcus taeanensis TaxID=2737050 RepID=UPI001CDB83C3|nr:winged helix-turn-helix domain-containing protein [Deinococcus taeanensis]UBV45449.1 winged helix-turn-helix domain-containing protein [Deinococcus taeanensis]